jgi:hypothetical protein
MRNTTNPLNFSWVIWFVIFCVAVWIGVQYIAPRSAFCSQGMNAAFFPVLCSGFLHF